MSCSLLYFKGDPIVNFNRQVNRMEEFVTVFNCKGHKKDMDFLLELFDKAITVDKRVCFLVADGANGGLLRKVEEKYPW